MNVSDDDTAPPSSTLQELFDSSLRHSVKWNSYFAVYERTLARFVGKAITLVEVGVGDGGSLLMWKSYFRNARIIGVDHNPRARELTAPGVEIIIGDQASEAFWDQFYESVGPIDVLLDDGGHSNEQQIVTVTRALGHVRDGGLILVEDVHASYQAEYLNPARSSFINFAKYLVDGVNSRSPVVGWKGRYCQVIASLEFHESIVVIHVDRRGASAPVLGAEPGVAVAPPAPARPGGPARLQFIRRIPLAGPLVLRCLRVWRTAVMNRRLARYFR
jgi:hypothetical protein